MHRTASADGASSVRFGNPRRASRRTLLRRRPFPVGPRALQRPTRYRGRRDRRDPMFAMMMRAARLALVTLIALGAGGDSALAQSKLPTVTVIASPDDAITPVLYAKTSGMFERAGLDVQIAKGTGGAAVTAAVVGGSYDIGHAGLLALFTAHIHRVPVVIIAPGAYFQPQNPYAGLLVSTAGGINSAKDLD